MRGGGGGILFSRGQVVRVFSDILVAFLYLDFVTINTQFLIGEENSGFSW